MKVRHVKPQGTIEAGSFKDSAWAYRTEVHNPFDFPIRIVWFQSFGLHDGNWYGWNITNSVLNDENFEQWYAEGDPCPSGWIALVTLQHATPIGIKVSLRIR